MCWSKRSSGDEDSGRTTTQKPMDPSVTGCRGTEVKCEGDAQKNHCSGHGICCHEPNDTSKMNCVCHTGWTGIFCESRIPEYSKDVYERAQAIAAISAVLGMIVITLFVALVILQIKYYRRRKRRHRKEYAHELNKISRRDACENDEGSKKRLTVQPGYSWRESVRRAHSKAAQKFRSTLSRSVPEDLFQVGLKMAIFGGWKPNHGPIDQQSVAKKAEVKTEVKAEKTHRCFSAGPDIGESSHQMALDVRDRPTVSDQPSIVQVPATVTTAAEAEDTVK